MEQFHMAYHSLHSRLLNDYRTYCTAAKQVRAYHNRLHWVRIPSARRENSGILFVWPEGSDLSLARVVPDAFCSSTKRDLF